MGCAECRASFAALEMLDDSRRRATEIDRAQPNCRCQPFSVSEFSAGVVINSEKLIRILVAPQHMNNKRAPKAAALTEAETHGLSLLRDEVATDDEIVEVADGLVTRARRSANAKAGVFGVLLILA